MSLRPRSAADAALAEAAEAALAKVVDPATGRSLTDLAAVDSIQAQNGLLQVSLLVAKDRAAAMEGLRGAAESALARLPGLRNATVILTAHRDAAPAAQTGHGHEGHGHAATAGRAPVGKPGPLPGIKTIIAVGSGKGGVGKSTVAVNLAVALAKQGLRVGLMDADIYGPSLHRMLGETRKPEVQNDRILPIRAWGLSAMSMGFLVEEDSAMIWRGPMIMGAVQQFLGQVAWGELDTLVIDLPPGTGDIQLTLVQKAQITGAVIVSTPQDIALIDARRAVRMFEKVQVPVLGLIENMSVFHCPHCRQASPIFGHGGAKAEAAKLDCPFLGEIPLLLDVRESGDAGTPIVVSAPESEGAQAFLAIARGLAARLRLGETAVYS